MTCIRLVWKKCCFEVYRKTFKFLWNNLEKSSKHCYLTRQIAFSRNHLVHVLSDFLYTKFMHSNQVGCVCVLVYERTCTQTTRVLDVSPGVGRTPGEPEESRSTKAQYTCRPYRCTQYICLYICWVADFENLG